MAEKPLPYDAEVEYLTSYEFAVFLLPTDFDKIQFRIKLNNPASTDMKIFGNCFAYKGWEILSFFQSKYRGTSIPSANGVWDTVTVERGSLTVEREGGTIYNATSWWSPGSDSADTRYGTDMPFFATVVNNGRWVGNNMLSGCGNNTIFTDSVKTWKNGVLLSDYIPVRKGSAGYMYDRVSGQLFGNVNTDQSYRYLGYGSDKS